MFLAGSTVPDQNKQIILQRASKFASCGNSEIGFIKSSTHEMSETDSIEITGSLLSIYRFRYLSSVFYILN